MQSPWAGSAGSARSGMLQAASSRMASSSTSGITRWARRRGMVVVAHRKHPQIRISRVVGSMPPTLIDAPRVARGRARSRTQGHRVQGPQGPGAGGTTWRAAGSNVRQACPGCKCGDFSGFTHRFDKQPPAHQEPACRRPPEPICADCRRGARTRGLSIERLVRSGAQHGIRTRPTTGRTRTRSWAAAVMCAPIRRCQRSQGRLPQIEAW